MLATSLIGAIMIALTVTMHAVGTTLWVRSVRRRFMDRDPEWRLGRSVNLLIGTGLILVALHTLQIMLWAWVYMLVVPSGSFQSMSETVYFSFVTFTTLGYGDITLRGDYRVLSGIEAMNGILLVGWSTAVLFAIVQRMWQNIGSAPANG
jgi:hypothetical protein